MYSVLYIISPYINIIIKNISKENFKRLIIISTLNFSVWTIFVDVIVKIYGPYMNGLSSIGAYGSQYGYSIVNFILIYLIGVYLRLYGMNINKKKIIIGIISIYIILYILSLLENITGGVTVTWNYNNPLIIYISALILIYFSKIEYHSKLINEFAKCAFTCFLLHQIIIGYIGIKNAVSSNVLLLILHQIISACIIYLISYIVYKVYYICTE